MNVRRHAKYPPCFLNEKQGPPPRGKWSGLVTFDGRVKWSGLVTFDGRVASLVPASLSYIRWEADARPSIRGEAQSGATIRERGGGARASAFSQTLLQSPGALWAQLPAPATRAWGEPVRVQARDGCPQAALRPL